MDHCELCAQPGGELLWRGRLCRVVLVGGAEGEAYPGFCRVVWNEHRAELSDLVLADSLHLMQVVLGVECAIRDVLQPDKVNLASLGNVVPHLHWHVIPRWKNDCNFPRPIWGASLRPNPARTGPRAMPFVQKLTDALNSHLGEFA